MTARLAGPEKLPGRRRVHSDTLATTARNRQERKSGLWSDEIPAKPQVTTYLGT